MCAGDLWSGAGSPSGGGSGEDRDTIWGGASRYELSLIEPRIVTFEVNKTILKTGLRGCSAEKYVDSFCSTIWKSGH